MARRAVGTRARAGDGRRFLGVYVLCQDTRLAEAPPAGTRLTADGASGELATIPPGLSPPVWTTIATGRRPSKYALAALQFVAAGLAELGHMLPVLARFERERELARQRREKRRAAH